MNDPMTLRDSQPRRSPLGTFVHFVSTRYPLLKHGIYCVLWHVSLTSVLREISGVGGTWRFGLADVVSVATLFLLFFFMRTVDEYKDLDYDRVHNPERPMAAGLVGVPQMRVYLSGTAALVVALNAWLSPWLVAIAVGVMGYSLFLVWLEHRSPGFERSLYLNTFVAIQLKVGTALYVYALLCHRASVAPSVVGLGVALCFVAVYLHWETSRKIVWPGLARAGEKLYSRSAGVAGSLVVSWGLFGLGVLPVLVLLAPWHEHGVALLAGFAIAGGALPSIAGTILLLSRRDKRAPIGVLTLGAYLVFLLAALAYGMLRHPVAWVLWS